MNPYLLPLAKQQQAQIRQEVENEHKLKEFSPESGSSTRQDLSSPALVAPFARSILGIFRKRGKMPC